MTLKRISILISFLLIFIFAFYLLPSFSSDFEGGGDLQKSKGYIIVYSLDSHTQTLVQEGRRPSIQTVSLKNGWFYEYQAASRNNSIQNSNQKEIVFYTHQRIKNLISLYFHGSKYKQAHLFI